MRFLADENFNNTVLSALRGVLHDIDLVRVQDTEIYQAADPDVLAWAAKENRILLTHDVQTMIKFAYDRVRHGLVMPGVIEVYDRLPIGQVVEELSILIGAGTASDFENQVKYVPVR